MEKATLLFADNDGEFLGTRSRFLEKHGFKVMSASSPEEASEILERGDIDLAILDMRLRNDSDDADFSGLDLAKTLARDVPKIILTRFPSTRSMRRALRPGIDGLPTAFDYVSKLDGAEVLLDSVNRALKLIPVYRELSNNLASKINQTYDDARKQAFWSYWFSVGSAIIGICIVFLASYRAVDGAVAVAVPSVLSGLIAAAVIKLFFNRADTANHRMDEQLREFNRLKWMDNLMAACDELSPDERRDICKERLIEAAAGFLHLESRHIPLALTRERANEATWKLVLVVVSMSKATGWNLMECCDLSQRWNSLRLQRWLPRRQQPDCHGGSPGKLFLPISTRCP